MLSHEINGNAAGRIIHDKNSKVVISEVKGQLRFLSPNLHNTLHLEQRSSFTDIALAQCKSVVSDILGEIEFCIDIEKYIQKHTIQALHQVPTQTNENF